MGSRRCLGDADRLSVRRYRWAAIDPTLLPYVTSGLIVVVVSPLALLAAYILRMATITRRTASVGPMIPQKAPEEDPFDVSYNEDKED